MFRVNKNIVYRNNILIVLYLQTLVYALNLIDAGLTASPSNHEKDECLFENYVTLIS